MCAQGARETMRSPFRKERGLRHVEEWSACVDVRSPPRCSAPPVCAPCAIAGYMVKRYEKHGQISLELNKIPPGARAILAAHAHDLERHFDVH